MKTGLWRVAVLSVSLASVACSSDPEGSQPGNALLAPPPAGKGIQLGMVTSVASGDEVEHCKFFEMPAEGMYIQRSETRFTKGSHHVLLYLTTYDEIPTQNDRGEPVDTSGVFDCSDGATNGWSVTSIVGGSQNSDGEGPVDFPPGVAMKVAPRAIVLMNAHYVNSTESDLTPEVRMNLFSLPENEVEHEGGLLFFYNAFIKVDANGVGKARMSCPIDEDVTLFTSTSHMHRRGVGFQANVLGSDGSDSLFSTDSWEGVPVTHWQDGHSLSAGSRVEYECSYENPEARAVYQGPRSTDEMCVFAAAYYPVNPTLSLCALKDADPYEMQQLGASWIGHGDKTCGETLSCMAQIDQEAAYLEPLTDCVLAAAPSEAERVSNMVRCFLTHDDPVADCSAQIAACQTPAEQ